MSEPRLIVSGLNEENMHLFITVIKRKKNKATIISKALHSYTCFLEDHREKHEERKKNKINFDKELSNEERIYLICEDAKLFYKKLHNGPCVVERSVNFESISDQLDECFNLIHQGDFACEKILYFPNLVAMFYANLRIKKDPLTLFSLAKGTMITLSEEKLGEILGINALGPRIFGKTFSSLGWSKTEAMAMLFGVRSDKVYRNENSLPINCLTPRAHVLAKLLSSTFSLKEDIFLSLKWTADVFYMPCFTLTNFNLSYLS